MNKLPGTTTTPPSVGLIFGISAYLIWGFFPIYFRALGSVPPLQVVSHRIVWSALFLAMVITLRRGWGEVAAAFSRRGTLLLLATTALLIATNWLIFIIAVDHANVLQSSLGYFMTPFVSVILGVVLLKERLRRLQVAALVLALIGVALITLQQTGLPWAALTLAATFGTYGLLRKVAGVDALAGLAVETFILAPAAAGYLVYAELHGMAGFWHSGAGIDALLVCAGLVTSLPLLLFAAAARRLRLATIGFLQYLTPTMHFLIAVKLYREPFTVANLTSFGFIWLGLLLYSADALRMVRLTTYKH
ncbi:putative transporter [Geobacter sp. OR-1]|uniref:EamA family transporter RarD n=1 Tax=Geobacter sp. OR-1 TaxID=1266765 RepID=UPI000541D6DB|nr:EamA family transporter RarD [Geobacter sp. OR-1]GAM08599.1 putative transporter [Geobacter sp. OR-1]